MYESLYAKYQQRSVSELIDFAGNVKGKCVLDLCGGTGRLAEECAKRDASEITVVDASKDMTRRISVEPYLLLRVRVCNRDVSDFLKGHFKCWFTRVGPDFVFCRQAVNYWFDKESESHLARHLKTGALFVFNTFNTIPREEPHFTQYTFPDDNGVDREFTEVVVFDKTTNMIHHMQAREGLPMHATSFKWISPDQFDELLRDHFDFTVKIDGRASLYRCVRK